MASKRLMRRRECGDKKPLERQTAHWLAMKMRQEQLCRVLPYHCRWCGKYHVGHC